METGENRVVRFHNPGEPYGYLSNWYLSEFTVDGVRFSSVEQYMMYQKAVLFNDRVTAGRILKTADPAEIKALGRAVSGYRDGSWAAVRKEVVKKAVFAKFSQNALLKTWLLNTDNQLLAECAVRDHVWGTGTSIFSSDSDHPERWKGQNLLGTVLMEVRDELRQYLGYSGLSRGLV